MDDTIKTSHTRHRARALRHSLATFHASLFAGQSWRINVLLVVFGLLCVGGSVLVTGQLLVDHDRHELREDRLAFQSHAGSLLDNLVLSARILSQMPDVRDALHQPPAPDPNHSRRQILNTALEEFVGTIAADVAYVMDLNGETIAASNWRDTASFVGKNYRFRPYFQLALQQGQALYAAQGVTSGALGLYFSHVIRTQQDETIGVAVIKYPGHALMPKQHHEFQTIPLLLDENQIIVAAGDSHLLFRTLRPLEPAQRERLERERKFSVQSLQPLSGHEPQQSSHAGDILLTGMVDATTPIALRARSSHYILTMHPLNGAPGWHVAVIAPGTPTVPMMILAGSITALIYTLVVVVVLFFRRRHTYLEQIRLLIRHTPMAMAMFDSELRYLQVSHRWLDDHNQNIRDIIGHFVHETQPVTERWSEIYQRGLEGQWQRQDAEPFVYGEETEWITWEVRPWYTAYGKIGGIVLFKENVTQRVRMEQELKRHSEKLAFERSFIENVIVRMRSSQHFNPSNLRYLMAPVEKTAGDILLSAVRPDGGRHILLGDFTGHGLTSALGGPLVSDIFYSMTTKDITLHEILKEINQQLNRKMPTGMFMAGCFVEVAPDGRQIMIWNCSMPEVLYYYHGAPDAQQPPPPPAWRRISSTNLPCGVLGRTIFSGVTLHTVPGDRLYICSDGVTEAGDENYECFGIDSLQALLQQIIDRNEPLDTLITLLDAYRARQQQEDDISLLELVCA